MKGRISLSRKDAEALVAYFDEHGYEAFGTEAQRAVERIGAGLKPRAKKQLRKDRERQEKAKRAEKNAETSEIRQAVFARAGGRCECGCGRRFSDADPGELDHWHGRVRVAQSVETTWALAHVCHVQKTNWTPSKKAWLERRLVHCRSHGYTSEAAKAQRELESMALLAEAGELMLRKAGGR